MPPDPTVVSQSNLGACVHQNRRSVEEYCWEGSKEKREATIGTGTRTK